VGADDRVTAARRVLARRRSDDAWARHDWDVHRHAHEVDGRRGQFVDIGSGPVVVLVRRGAVYGQGGSWQFWLRVLPRLSLSCRVIAIDLYRFGESEPVTDGDLIDGQLRAITGVADHLGITEYVCRGTFRGWFGHHALRGPAS